MATKKHMMKRLKRFAIIISAKRNEKPYSKFVALRKLFIQEKRIWPSGNQIGWKRGELFEVLQAKSLQEFKKEWGDVGYYVASSYGVFKLVYLLVTPKSVLEQAVSKFKRRAFDE